jgi:hypothetical protein
MSAREPDKLPGLSSGSKESLSMGNGNGIVVFGVQEQLGNRDPADPLN